MNKNQLASAVVNANYRKTCLPVVLGSLAVALLHMPAQAQNPEEGPGPIEEMIVTGTPGGVAVRRFDASFAISIVDAEEIKQVSPASTADLLKTIPGVWVESSGGVSGANIFVRGLPSGGDADFVSLAINGLAVYPAPTLSFMENSTLFRVDETIERLEGLRGGPNPVYSNGQVGLTTNFILKEGGEDTEGSVRYTTSDYDLQRIDGMVSGKLDDDLYYMIGGYISSSPGVRDAGFNAEEGHQFTINITRMLDNGKINVFHRSTNDHGTWYLPVALDVNGIETGLDASYTQVGQANRQVLVPISGPDGEGGSETRWESFDMGEGRGWDGSVTGGAVELNLDNGWVFIDRFSLTSGAANTQGFVPQNAAVTLGSLNGGVAGETVSGAAVAASDLVQQFGPWVVHKDVKAFNNDLSLAKLWDDYKLTVGYYTSSWEVDEWWSIGNQKWYQLGHNGGMISPDSIDEACQAADVATCNFKYDVDALGDARENAFYVAGETYIGDVTLDAGVRFANRKTSYSVDDGAVDGVTDFVVDADENKVSYTAAANWNFRDDMGVFLRINDGHKYPDFDAYRDFRGDYNSGSDLMIDVSQVELGYKLSRDIFSLYATAFSNNTKGQPFCNIGGAECARLETETIGVELDGKLYLGDFVLDLNATIQEPEIANGDLKGNQVLRQPTHQMRLTPSYNFSFGNGVEASVYGTFSVISDRYGDNANDNQLDSYTKLDLGAQVNMGNLNLQLAVDNATDELALTESDPRSVGTSANGRYILPRNVKFSVGYNF
jgi:outer membrane cobalamin receptor